MLPNRTDFDYRGACMDMAIEEGFRGAKCIEVAERYYEFIGSDEAWREQRLACLRRPALVLDPAGGDWRIDEATQIFDYIYGNGRNNGLEA